MPSEMPSDFNFIIKSGDTMQYNSITNILDMNYGSQYNPDPVTLSITTAQIQRIYNIFKEQKFYD